MTPIAIAIQTVWDTPADAVAFAAAAGTTRGKLTGSTALIDPGTTNRVTVFVGIGRAGDQPARRGARPGGLNPGRAAPRYISSGAEIPSSPRVLASVIRVASARARRARERSGSAGSTTRASR